DDHSQYLLLAGRAGGQSAIGGTAASQELTLTGTTNANLGQVRFGSPIIFDDVSAANALNPYFVRANPSQTFSGAFVGGGASFSPTITFTGSTFVWEGMQIAPSITSGTPPGFAAFTLLNALPVLRGGVAGNNPLNSLTLNVGVTMENFGVGVALTTATNFGVSFSPQTRVTGIFSTMSVTNQTAVSCRPTFSTVNTSVANLGTIRAVHAQSPAVALFQPAAGTETMTAYIGLDMDNITFGGNVEKVAVRSALAAASNAYFLRNTGTAQSVLNGQLLFPLDLTGITFGASGDMNMGYGGTDFFFLNFVTGNTGQLRISSELEGNTTDRFLIEGLNQDSELNLNFDRLSLGAQSGSVGNQVCNFVTPTRTTAINGGWADILLTHAGNITINHTMTDVCAWVINPLSITAGTGSITDFAATFVIGGMATSGLGGADTHAVRVTGRNTLRGVHAFEPLSPSTLTADVNDYAPATGTAMRQVWRVASDDLGVRTITGIAAQQSVDTQWITNIGTVDNIILAHQNAGSAAGNRIISPTGANLTLGPDESALLWHDDVTDRWRILFHTGA
ncbi:MAG: hypothetical protein ACR2QF_02235, partial [Geminicoccaceae bacterium]